MYAGGTNRIQKHPRVDMYGACIPPNQYAAPPETAAGLWNGMNTGIANLSSEEVDRILKQPPRQPQVPNHILLLTVLNPSYPITCDVLNNICSFRGKVLRIVIFCRNGVQAMVEFDSIEAANRIKEFLHGCDIYPGCCTLKIDYGKPSKLNVFRNDARSCDYTAGNVSPQSTRQRPVLLQLPLPPMQVMQNGLYRNHIMSLAGGNVPRLQSHVSRNGNFHPSMNPHGASGDHMLMDDSLRMSASKQFNGNITGTPCVCMVYGLSVDKMNPDRLFNLFCLYGNVARIKFLKTKEGCAMVQMGSHMAVDCVINNLSNVSIFGCKLQISYSKQSFISEVVKPNMLVNGNPCYKGFEKCRNNRFLNEEQASKNRIQPPSSVLHYFNAPPLLSHSDMDELFTEHNLPQPASVKKLTSKSDRSSTGLIDCSTTQLAVEALTILNHCNIPNPGGNYPFILRMCFSHNR